MRPRSSAGVALPALVMFLALLGPSPAMAHEGGLGSLGCHTDRAAGNYHCHGGKLAGRVFPNRKVAREILREERHPARARRQRSPVQRRENTVPATARQVAPSPTAPTGEPTLRFNSESRELTSTEVFKRASPSVYVLLTYKGSDASGKPAPYRQGSAVAVTRHLALTNCHVLEDGERFTLVKDGRMALVERHAGHDRGDRCIVRSSAPLQPIGHLRRLDDMTVGEKVYSIGSPSGLENTLGEGLLSGKRDLSGVELIQTTAPISPGSSGGGLFDRFGNLVGITTFLLKETQNLNFAIPVERFPLVYH